MPRPARFKQKDLVPAMPRPVRFTQTDYYRAMKAAEKAGIAEHRILFRPDGVIEVVTAKPVAPTFDNPWDEVLS
jgi:hypothetical protein